jgi:hypothetical protein
MILRILAPPASNGPSIPLLFCLPNASHFCSFVYPPLCASLFPIFLSSSPNICLLTQSIVSSLFSTPTLQFINPIPTDDPWLFSALINKSLIDPPQPVPLPPLLRFYAPFAPIIPAPALSPFIPGCSPTQIDLSLCILNCFLLNSIQPDANLLLVLTFSTPLAFCSVYFHNFTLPNFPLRSRRCWYLASA